ncbi:hypothetical protein S7335_2926 [Synechococcus sp. PCC 7335]|uniref:hypothetical protein n=1 Tax=Synechococcus sp. (strain ATCC 29403 / PCC 7335) TaxID=91464 RepID=UPI00017EE761|nr:hypothetical protein [Synechococcus sp. PCC 7335]EDX85227.1 hypothetical protein S7335_2926 [Synechococcus sp. PCC 7335]
MELPTLSHHAKAIAPNHAKHLLSEGHLVAYELCAQEEIVKPLGPTPTQKAQKAISIAPLAGR